MQCSICFENFDHSRHKPFVIIPCTHTICISCLSNLNDQTCPNCNKPFTSNNPNWILLDILPESDYDKLKGKLEKSLNDLKTKSEEEYEKKFKLLETKISNHTQQIIKSIEQSQEKYLIELKSSLLKEFKNEFSDNFWIKFESK